MEETLEVAESEHQGELVHLFIYDLSAGLCSYISEFFLGRKIDGVWHTSVVAHEREYFYGSSGIVSCDPKTTFLGNPMKILNIGYTNKSYDDLEDLMHLLSETTFNSQNYHLFHFNCNNFSNFLCNHLCRISIPNYIINFTDEALATRIGQFTAQFYETFTLRPGAIPLENVKNRNVENHEGK